jgi:hypothetical protein
MKAKRVHTRAGSFPKFAVSRLLKSRTGKRWQVLCGDKNHWRIGFYSPGESRNQEVKQLEKHSCVELFMLLSGSQTLIIDDGKGERELKLKPMQPVMVRGWHCGYSPQGPHTGVSLVVERDRFSTIYRNRKVPKGISN